MFSHSEGSPNSNCKEDLEIRRRRLEKFSPNSDSPEAELINGGGVTSKVQSEKVESCESVNKSNLGSKIKLDDEQSRNE